MTTPSDAGNQPGEPDVIDFAPIHDLFAQQVMQHFKSDGRVHSNIYFIELARPVKRQPLPKRVEPMDPRLTHEFMSSREARDRLTNFLRDALTAGTPARDSLRRSLGFEPDIIVHVDEAWMAAPKPGEDAADVVPSQHASRREVVMISIHHRWGGTIVNTLPIIQQPNRHVKFQKLPNNVLAVYGPMAMTPDTRS